MSPHNNVECEATNALTINPENLINLAIKTKTTDNARSRYRTDAGRVPKREYEIHKLEEQILLCRQNLAMNEGDAEEIQTYITEAGAIYHQHLTKKLRLSHINAKNAKPPVLPITFTTEETSELYWVLVQYRSIESVLTQIEQGLRQNKVQVSKKMAQARCKTRKHVISKVIEVLDTALAQWRPHAYAAVNGRCIAIQDMILAEVAGDSQGADGKAVVDGTS